MTSYTVTLDGEVVARQVESRHVDSVIYSLESEGVDIDDVYWNEDEAKVELTSRPEELSECYVCEALTTGFEPVCEDCEESGFWIDPAGGIHSRSDDDKWRDPTEMYK